MSPLFATLVEAATGRGGSVRPPPRPRYTPDDGLEPPEDPEVVPGASEPGLPTARDRPARTGSGDEGRAFPDRSDERRSPAPSPQPAQTLRPTAAPAAAPSAPPGAHHLPPPPVDRAVAQEPDDTPPYELSAQPLARHDPSPDAPLLPPTPADRREFAGRHRAEHTPQVRTIRGDPAPPASVLPPEIRIEKIEVHPPAPVAVTDAKPLSRGPARAAPRQSLDDYLALRGR